jgi:hypothetical protein
LLGKGGGSAQNEVASSLYTVSLSRSLLHEVLYSGGKRFQRLSGGTQAVLQSTVVSLFLPHTDTEIRLLSATCLPICCALLIIQYYGVKTVDSIDR